MMHRWTKIFQLSKTISKINFSFLNFRYKLKGRPDTYFIVLTCFVLSIIGVLLLLVLVELRRFRQTPPQVTASDG